MDNLSAQGLTYINKNNYDIYSGNAFIMPLSNIPTQCTSVNQKTNQISIPEELSNNIDCTKDICFMSPKSEIKFVDSKNGELVTVTCRTRRNNPIPTPSPPPKPTPSPSEKDDSNDYLWIVPIIAATVIAIILIIYGILSSKNGLAYSYNYDYNSNELNA